MKILIIDDHDVVRDGVKRIISEQPGPNVFGEASTGQEALSAVSERDWDVIVLDLSLGGRSGLEVLKDVKQTRPRIPVLILSMHSEEQYARRAFKAGAAGYITKGSPRAELLSAVQKVMKGGRYVSAAVAEQLAGDLERGTEQRHQTLSDREFEVLQWIALGKSVTEISLVLSLSDKTISTYRARILDKMGMRTNAEITRYAIQNGLVE